MVEVTVDQYDLTLGDWLPQLMEQSISDMDYVLVICTPMYKIKSGARKGGVGYEGHIISDELLTTGMKENLFLLFRKGSIGSSLPDFLVGKYGIDFTSGRGYKENYMDLVTTIYGDKKESKVGSHPSYITKTYAKPAEEDMDRPIRILGIITDEVTVPKMDETRGSTLYKGPFRLSKTPSSL